MKSKLIFLLGIVAVLGSCTSAYRIGQTPDDVYYSPAPPSQAVYVTSNNQQDQDSYDYNNSNADNSENLAIRRGISNPVYRSSIALDYGYGYDPYDNYGSSFYSPYSSYYNAYNSPLLTFYPYNSYYSNFYSPYYNYYYPQAYYITKPGNTAPNYNIAPRRYNLRPYSSSNYIEGGNYRPSQNITTSSVPIRTFAPPISNRTGSDNSTRRIYTPANNDNNRSNNNNTYTPPERTFTPAPTQNNNSSSGSNSGGGSAPVRTFRR